MDTQSPQVPQQPQNINMSMQNPPQKDGAGQAVSIVIIILIIILGGVYFWMMQAEKSPEAIQSGTPTEDVSNDALLNDLDAGADANINGDLDGIDNELK